LAEEICCGALDRFPDDANFLCLSARCLIKLGRFDSARTRLDRASRLFPEFPRPYEVRGELALEQSLAEQAVEHFEHAIRLDPKRSDTYLKLGRALAMAGREDDALKAVEESNRLTPFQDAIRKAVEFERAGDPDKAEKIYRKILTQDPDNVDVLRLLAAVAVTHRHFRDAEIFLRRALDNAPDFARAWADLVIVQMELDKSDEAINSAERLVRLDRGNPESFLLLGNACGTAGRHEEALANYQQVLDAVPDHAGALSGMGHMLKTVGQQEAAIKAYRRCIRENPNFAEPYWSLANFKTFRFEDDEVTAMKKLLEKEGLADESQVQLCNALGFELDGREDFDQAFSYFERGNAVRRRAEYYDPVDTEDTHDRTIQVFSREFLHKKAERGHSDAAAIFIVGLPRSGSTLIEQILASHPEVEGTHELSDLGRTIRTIPRQQSKKKSRYPEVVSDLDDESFATLGEYYIERTRKYRGGRAHFTDKNPNNYTNIGLLHLILPNAKIINAKRHPLDSCFGSYKQLFAKGQPFSYDLVELGDYFVQYQRLMDHWHTVLPGKVLDVQYEDVVENLEVQVRRILQYCDLSWDDRCLRFHETGRAIKTASSEQVRQAIYQSSVNTWRNYESHLDPLIEVLEPILMDLNEADRPASLAQSRV